LLSIDKKHFSKIANEIQQDEVTLKNYDLAEDMTAYLKKIGNEMSTINDSDRMAFLLKRLPEHFGDINS